MDKGKIAKARRIVGYIDKAIALCETDEALGIHEYREVQSLIFDLYRARMSVANVAMRYGDDRLYGTQPRISLKIDYEK